MIRFLPVIIVMILIFYLSHLPGDAFSVNLPANSDKLAHGLIYGLLASTCLYAIYPLTKHHELLRYGIIIIFCLVYGVSDEWHQSFVPFRSPSFFDVIADVAGAAIAVVAHKYWKREREI